jgi:hypothetical protein
MGYMVFECPLEKCESKKYTTYVQVVAHVVRVHQKIYAEITGVKWCHKCKELKELHYFSKSTGSSSGYQTRCKECSNKIIREYNKTPNGRKKKNELKFAWYSGMSKGRFQMAKSKAVRKGKTWLLTEEEYFSLLRLPCDYCGFEIRNSGIGLDRKDSSNGYTLENCCSCCLECNQAKSDFLTYDEMKNIVGPAIKLVKDNRLLQKENTFTEHALVKI